MSVQYVATTFGRVTLTRRFDLKGRETDSIEWGQPGLWKFLLPHRVFALVLMTPQETSPIF